MELNNEVDDCRERDRHELGRSCISARDAPDRSAALTAGPLLSQDGKVTALITGVGGFLAMGEKDVAVPFDAVKHTVKDGKIYLTLDTTKEAMKAAPGLKYDRKTTTWVPDSK